MASRVLIVDDSEAVISQLTAILRQVVDDAEIQVARDLASARRTLAAWRPDVIFLDLMLDREHGLDLLWDIGRAFHGARVVTMSGFPREDAHVLAAQRVSPHHLEKPLRTSAVAAVLAGIDADGPKA